MSDAATPPKPLANDCFALPPGVHWTPVAEALARLRARMRPIAPIERLPIEAVGGRILAEDAVALRAHPACDNAAVDGYAFAHPGTADPVELKPAKGRAAAGAPWNGVLPAGQALRILTGAPMPEGADTVVLQEDVEEFPGGLISGRRLRFTPPKKPGANRRRAGENIRPGDRVLTAGARLSPQATAQLAAAGLSDLPVYAPLRVAVISTGSELAQPGAERDLTPDRVIDSNKPMLRGLVETTGAEVAFIATAGDTPEAVARALDLATGSADAVITSGGASGGEEDHVAAALSDAAAREQAGDEGDAFHLWRVAMKPGRPLAMGLWRGAPVFGLPGNPVAAFVCFLIFVRPALLALGGAEWTEPRPLMLESGFDHPKKPGRREYLRVRIGEDGRLEKYRSEGSGLIEGLLWSDGLADLAHEAGPVNAGDRIAYLPYHAFGIRA
ncbi:MAG: molybdopterin molybdotransferase MoeA [Pseudomonadota bacterium]